MGFFPFMRFKNFFPFLFVVACGASSTSSHDASSDSPVPSPDATFDAGGDGGVCGPVAVTTYTPSTMHPPNPPHAGKCTDQQSADYAACEGGNTAKCAEFGTGQPAEACGACIETKKSDATWGVVVFDGSSGLPNIEGCVDDALGQVSLEPSSCGQLLFASYGCQQAACGLCAGDALDTCVNASLTGGCVSFDEEVESTKGPCAELLGDAAPAASTNCFPDPALTDVDAQRADFLTRLAKYMCGS